MKLGLEISRANKANKTGTEWYAWHLFEQFKKSQQSELEFFVYYHQDLSTELKNAPANFIFKKLNWPFSKFWTYFRLSWELFWHPVDKFFATNSAPLFFKGELIATIHDLGFYKNPELYHPLERIYQKIAHTLLINRADKIITPSQNTADDVVRYFPQAKSKIQIIYHGYNREEFKVLSEAEKSLVKTKYNLPAKFLLYIGRLETKKNIQNLLRAFTILQHTDYHLVLAGRPGNYGYRDILELARNNSIKDRVHFWGYVSQVDYPLILASCDVFVFPSLFEGFGMPLLEAAACGVPMTVSDLLVLREVADTAALYFDPHQPAEIARIIDSLLSDDALRQQMIGAGLAKVQSFSWEKCARETLAYILV